MSELTLEEQLANLKAEYDSLDRLYSGLEEDYDELYNKHEQALTMLVHTKEVVKSMTNFIDAVVEDLN